MWIVGSSYSFNMAYCKVESYFSRKVPRLEERREAEQNSDGDDDEVNNGTRKDQAVISLKKDRIGCQNKSQSIVFQASPDRNFKCDRAPIFSGRRVLGPSLSHAFRGSHKENCDLFPRFYFLQAAQFSSHRSSITDRLEKSSTCVELRNGVFICKISVILK